MRLPSLLFFLLAFSLAALAEPEFPLTADSMPRPGVPQGTMLKDTHTAAESSVFPGTVREYQIYLPAGFDQSKPAPFMVFQDGVIYQSPVVFDNLIAKKDIPALVGVFIKPGVVPAANDNALPRFNRSHEYDSITDTYSRFLLEELLPAIEKKHGIKLSTDPNDTAIAGNSSGGICAFMVAWHRPDRFRRVFTGVGTYVGIHGADQLPVLVRKFEPKPLRVFLQSGTGDNNLYCGDWWMANQMMERSLTWAGYDVNHAWGEGGHNQKHASQVFPDAMRWLWRDWQTSKEVKANAKGESKWRGYEVVGDGEWKEVARLYDFTSKLPDLRKDQIALWRNLACDKDGSVFVSESTNGLVVRVRPNGEIATFGPRIPGACGMAALPEGKLAVCSNLAHPQQKPGDNSESKHRIITLDLTGKIVGEVACEGPVHDVAVTHSGEKTLLAEESWGSFSGVIFPGPAVQRVDDAGKFHNHNRSDPRSRGATSITLSPDQTQLYASQPASRTVELWKLAPLPDGFASYQPFVRLDDNISPEEFERVQGGGICVDTNGWIYVTTTSGIQVSDQCGRVNFIIPTPQTAADICFGGPKLDELFIVTESRVYKRATKAKGCISGQMAPIKPAPPKL